MKVIKWHFRRNTNIFRKTYCIIDKPIETLKRFGKVRQFSRDICDGVYLSKREVLS